jgi:nucleoside-diphosphate-sugar epimerase
MSDLVIAVTAASGRLGRPLVRRLRAEGHTVIAIPSSLGAVPGADVFIHLARDADWTRRLLARIADLDRPPGLFVTASRVRLPGVPTLRLRDFTRRLHVPA